MIGDEHDPEEVIAHVKKRAKNNFKTGLNCAESVFEAVMSHIDAGLPRETMCIMTGFGGGGGLFGDTCGALVGAMAALGAVYGRREVPTNAKAAREELYGDPGLYRLFNRLPNEFKAALWQHPVPLVDLPVAENLALQGPPALLPQPGHRGRRAGRGDGGA